MTATSPAPPLPAPLDELSWRGLIAEQTPGLAARLARGPITGYVGFDPTARSLQVGNLVPIMLLAHLQRGGSKPIVVVGGGTGLIGDPSGQRAERPLLTAEQVAANVARQRGQLERFLDFSPGPCGADMVDNATWLGHLLLVPFLRDIGKHFTLSYMLQKESVKGRMEAGISYTEFSYMLLQAYDFLHLYRSRRCELQMGGSDQWGNITAGIELIRRVAGQEAHGLAAPLLTTATGMKFGKTSAGAVWLDPELTSPYQFYQYWINADDRDVESFLKMFTLRSRDDLAGLIQEHRRAPGARMPHRVLARELTDRVHGADQAERVAQASAIVFGDFDASKATGDVWRVLRAELPSFPLPEGATPQSGMVDILGASGVVKSKSEARRLITQRGLSWNGSVPGGPDAAIGAPLAGGVYWVRVGKTKHAILYDPRRA